MEFVKEAESRGSREGKDVSQKLESEAQPVYYWTIGICASLITAMVVVFVTLQVRNRFFWLVDILM